MTRAVSSLLPTPAAPNHPTFVEIKKNRRLSTRPIHTVRIQLAEVPCKKIEKKKWCFISYCRRSSILPAEDCFGMIQVRIKRHRWHSSLSYYILFVSETISKYPIQIFSLDDHSIRMRTRTHCFATLYGSSVDRSTKIVKLTCTLQDLQEEHFIETKRCNLELRHSWKTKFSKAVSNFSFSP